MEAQALPRAGRMFLPRNPRVLATFSDDRLVEQIRRGNEAAFEAIYDRHHLAILSFCRHMLSSADEAEDAVQQTFISAYSGLAADRRDIRLKPWLYTIARNRCLSTLRARRESPAEVDEIPTAGLSHQVEQRADLRQLLDDLRELPVDQREALVLSELGDLSHAEVGAVVGCEVAKVKSLVFQARSSLIESRKARDIPCHEIREQLATASGGVLRRGPLRRHISACQGCAEFRDDVKKQRRALAAILPVVPTLGLKKSALAAMGIGGGGGGAAAVGGAAGGGWVASVVGTTAAVKAGTVVVVAGLAVGSAALFDQTHAPTAADAAGGQPPSQASLKVLTAAAGGPGAGTILRPAQAGAARTAGAGLKPSHGNLPAPDPASTRGNGNSQSGPKQWTLHHATPGMNGNHRGAQQQASAAPSGHGPGATHSTPSKAHSQAGGGNSGHQTHSQHAQDVGGVHVPGGQAPRTATLPSQAVADDKSPAAATGNDVEHRRGPPAAAAAPAGTP